MQFANVFGFVIFCHCAVSMLVHGRKYFEPRAGIEGNFMSNYLNEVSRSRSNEFKPGRRKFHEGYSRNGGCGIKRFSCGNSQCINAIYLCDGEKDCTNGLDEDDIFCKEPVAVRLADGPNIWSGRVEIRYNGVWGTICDDAWDAKDAVVVCRMLGYDYGGDEVEAHHEADFGKGKGVVWLDEVQCTGKETSIENCPHNSWGRNNCGHREDAGVTCRTAPRNKVNLANHQHVTPKPVTGLPEICGRVLISQPEYKMTGRVVGGHGATPGSHPWIVGIRIRKFANLPPHHCGGAIIAEFHVLTAAHCIRSHYKKELYTIRAGDYDNEVYDLEETEFEVNSILVHEQFNNETPLNNDISVIKIKAKHGRGFHFGKFIQPICIPSLTMHYSAGTPCKVSGWGRTHKNVFATNLQEANVPILSWDRCRESEVYGGTRVTKNMICAGFLNGLVDTCQGDSGGPLECVVTTNNGTDSNAVIYSNRTSVTHYIFGIVSWGDGCGTKNKPGVYTRVQHFVGWIKNAVDTM